MSLVGNRRRLAAWLQDQLDRKGWSQSDLARAAGLHRAIISKITLESVDPKPETLTAIAKAFDVPPATVFVVAGELPPESGSDPLTDEGIHILKELEGDYKEDAVRYLRLRREVQDERQRGNVRKRKERPATAE